jgi:hypothetical protein
MASRLLLHTGGSENENSPIPPLGTDDSGHIYHLAVLLERKEDLTSSIAM